MGATAGERQICFELGGKWVPGFDISGHTFLLLYSILLISEEASENGDARRRIAARLQALTFRNWPLSPTSATARKLNRSATIEYKQRTQTVRYLFVGLFIVHLVWVRAARASSRHSLGAAAFRTFNSSSPRFIITLSCTK